eukprot:GEMP01001518.1.p1 GENE.GEMP01001518.1~~GEMP01001518.1.p1  ORF type:complete len:1557 (+),score=377.95 GEMP01001518.1:57-4673(+)
MSPFESLLQRALRDGSENRSSKLLVSLLDHNVPLRRYVRQRLDDIEHGDTRVMEQIRGALALRSSITFPSPLASGCRPTEELLQVEFPSPARKRSVSFTAVQYRHGPWKEFEVWRFRYRIALRRRHLMHDGFAGLLLYMRARQEGRRKFRRVWHLQLRATAFRRWVKAPEVSLVAERLKNLRDRIFMSKALVRWRVRADQSTEHIAIAEHVYHLRQRFVASRVFCQIRTYARHQMLVHWASDNILRRNHLCTMTRTFHLWLRRCRGARVIDRWAVRHDVVDRRGTLAACFSQWRRAVRSAKQRCLHLFSTRAASPRILRTIFTDWSARSRARRILTTIFDHRYPSHHLRLLVSVIFHHWARVTTRTRTVRYSLLAHCFAHWKHIIPIAHAAFARTTACHAQRHRVLTTIFLYWRLLCLRVKSAIHNATIRMECSHALQVQRVHAVSTFAFFHWARVVVRRRVPHIRGLVDRAFRHWVLETRATIERRTHDDDMRHTRLAYAFRRWVYVVQACTRIRTRTLRQWRHTKGTVLHYAFHQWVDNVRASHRINACVQERYAQHVRARGVLFWTFVHWTRGTCARRQALRDAHAGDRPVCFWAFAVWAARTHIMHLTRRALLERTFCAWACFTTTHDAVLRRHHPLLAWSRYHHSKVLARALLHWHYVTQTRQRSTLCCMIHAWRGACTTHVDDNARQHLGLGHVFATWARTTQCTTSRRVTRMHVLSTVQQRRTSYVVSASFHAWVRLAVRSTSKNRRRLHTCVTQWRQHVLHSRHCGRMRLVRIVAAWHHVAVTRHASRRIVRNVTGLHSSSVRVHYERLVFAQWKTDARHRRVGANMLAAQLLAVCLGRHFRQWCTNAQWKWRAMVAHNADALTVAAQTRLQAIEMKVQETQASDRERMRQSIDATAFAVQQSGEWCYRATRSTWERVYAASRNHFIRVLRAVARHIPIQRRWHTLAWRLQHRRRIRIALCAANVTRALCRIAWARIKRWHIVVTRAERGGARLVTLVDKNLCASFAQLQQPFVPMRQLYSAGARWLLRAVARPVERWTEERLRDSLCALVPHCGPHRPVNSWNANPHHGSDMCKLRAHALTTTLHLAYQRTLRTSLDTLHAHLTHTERIYRIQRTLTAAIRPAIARTCYVPVFARLRHLATYQRAVRRFRATQTYLRTRAAFTTFVHAIRKVRQVHRMLHALRTALLRTTFHTLARSARRLKEHVLTARATRTRSTLRTVLLHERPQACVQYVAAGWYRWRSLRARTEAIHSAVTRLHTLATARRSTQVAWGWHRWHKWVAMSRHTRFVQRFTEKERASCYVELVRGGCSRLSAVATAKHGCARASAFWRLKHNWAVWREKRRDQARKHELKVAHQQMRDAQAECVELRSSMDAHTTQTRQSVQTLEMERTRHQQWRMEADIQLRLLNEEINVEKASLAHSLQLTQSELRASKDELLNYGTRLREKERATQIQIAKVDALVQDEQNLRHEKDELRELETMARREVCELQKIIPTLKSELNVEVETRRPNYAFATKRRRKNGGLSYAFAN